MTRVRSAHSPIEECLSWVLALTDMSQPSPSDSFPEACCWGRVCVCVGGGGDRGLSVTEASPNWTVVPRHHLYNRQCQKHFFSPPMKVYSSQEYYRGCRPGPSGASLPSFVVWKSCPRCHDQPGSILTKDRGGFTVRLNSPFIDCIPLGPYYAERK